jgi:uncharacterized protein (TIGR00369 family)
MSDTDTPSETQDATTQDATLDLIENTGFAELVGYRLVHWEEGAAEIELPLQARHMNRSGVMHGGVLTTLIDTACGYTGCYCPTPGRVRRAMTLQLTCQFLSPGLEGRTVTAYGRKTGGGRSVFFATCEVRDEAGKLVGQGEGVFKYRRGSEDPEGEPA